MGGAVARASRVVARRLDGRPARAATDRPGPDEHSAHAPRPSRYDGRVPPRAALALCLVVVPACAAPRPARAPHPLLGAVAPPLSGVDVPGSPSARFDRRDVVVVVDFWTSACAPCAEQLPRLDALERRHGARLRVVGVSEDDELDAVAPFVARLGVRFAMLWDEHKATGARYRVRSVPQTFVIDPRGHVRFVHHGARDGGVDAIDAEVARLLAE